MAASLAAAVLVPVAVAAPAAPAAAQTASGGCQNPTVPTDAAGNPLIQPYDGAQDSMLIPTWGDGGGWTQPSQYETIMGGDVDGDGWGDLIGRNGVAVETYTPAPPRRSSAAAPYANAASSTWPVLPGQWVDKSVVTPPLASPPAYSGAPAFRESPVSAAFASHTWNPSAVPGFSDPSRYSTMRLADLDGNGSQELIVRVPVITGPQYGAEAPYQNNTFPNVPIFQGTKVMVYEFQTTTDQYGAKHGDWVLRTPTGSPLPEWDDSMHPSNGNQHFGNQSGPNASGNGGSFFLPQYYSSITTGNVDGLAGDELIGRGPNGIETYKWDSSSSQFTGPIESTTAPRPLADDDPAASGILSGPEHWASIRVADFAGNGHAMLAYRGTAGVVLYFMNQNRQWMRNDNVGATTAFNDASFGPGGSFDAWATISVANLDDQPGVELMGLNKAGQFVAYGYDPATQQLSRPVVAGQQMPSLFSSNSEALTMQGGDVTGGPEDEVLIRSSFGVLVYEYDSSTQQLDGSMVNSGPFPSTDNSGQTTAWNDPSHYLTIQTVPWRKGEKRVLIGRDATGVRTYQLVKDQTNTSKWVVPSTGFPQYAGGSDPNGWDATSDAGLAYRYLNDQVAFIMGWGTPTYPGQPVPNAPLPTIRSKFSPGSGVSNWSDIATLVEIQDPPTDAISPTLSRDDFEAVKRSTSDWTRDVAVVWGFLFQNSSGQSVEQIILTSLVVGDQAYPISQIQTQFQPPDKSRMWALIGDLLWGLATAANPELFFAGEGVAKLRARSIFQAVTSMTGAGIGAGLTYADKSGKAAGELDVEAAYLDQLLAATFCNSIAFLYGAAEQAANDLGLLTAMAQNLRALPPANQSYAQMIGQMSNQRAVWAYQQFASMTATGKGSVGWQMAFNQVKQDELDATWRSQMSDTYPPSGAGHGTYVPYYYQSYIGGPTNGSKNSDYWAYIFTPIGSKCDDGSNGMGRPYNAMLTLTQQLGIDPTLMAGTTQAFWDANKGWYDYTSGAWSGSPDQIYEGQPIPRRLDPDGEPGTNIKKIGSMGWRLPSVSACDPTHRVGYT